MLWGWVRVTRATDVRPADCRELCVSRARNVMLCYVMRRVVGLGAVASPLEASLMPVRLATHFVWVRSGASLDGQSLFACPGRAECYATRRNGAAHNRFTYRSHDNRHALTSTTPPPAVVRHMRIGFCGLRAAAMIESVINATSEHSAPARRHLVTAASHGAQCSWRGDGRRAGMLDMLKACNCLQS
jgi:hypothetical protein